MLLSLIPASSTDLILDGTRVSGLRRGGAGFMGILRNADPPLAPGFQDFWSLWERIHNWVYRAKKLTGLVSKPWLDILGKHPGGQIIGWRFWVGLPGKVPTCVILSEWHGRSKAKLLPTPAEYRLYCRLPGLCPSWMEAGGSQRLLVECTGTFQALLLCNNTIPWGFEPSGASRIGFKILTRYYAEQEKPPALKGTLS